MNAARGWARAAAIAAAARPERRITLSAERLADGRRWELDAARRTPAASTIKLAILVALLREVDAGRRSLAEIAAIAPEQRVGGSGVLCWLTPDLRLSLADLAYLTIAVSDNTASNTLVDLLGEERLRETIAALAPGGMELNRRFLGRLPHPDEGENFVSAAGLRAILTAIARDEAASPTACAWMRQTLERQQQRDLLARRLDEPLTFGGKSGWLPGLVHDAGLIGGPGGVLAVAVLTEGFTDPHEARETIGQIALALVEEAGIGAASETG
ncbi:MAG: serine hydrolase [Thermomicrobiales bacterium]|nr:serine hydrolase [Thermomicrobiales bacterium]